MAYLTSTRSGRSGLRLPHGEPAAIPSVDIEHTISRSLHGTDDRKRRGDTFPPLLHGCDGIRVLSALKRLGVPETKIPPTRPASRTDVLTGGGEHTP